LKTAATHALFIAGACAITPAPLTANKTHQATLLPPDDLLVHCDVRCVILPVHCGVRCVILPVHCGVRCVILPVHCGVCCVILPVHCGV